MFVCFKALWLSPLVFSLLTAELAMFPGFNCIVLLYWLFFTPSELIVTEPKAAFPATVSLHP